MALSLSRIVYGPQRAINCYIILSIWILVIIVGIYKFMEPIQAPTEAIMQSDSLPQIRNDIKTKKIFNICNQPQHIVTGDEGILKSNSWQLQGTLILIRHGDRGPLQHIQNISNVDCGTPETNLLAAYKNYLHNITVLGKVGSWIGPGSFHGFPLLPMANTQCQLGQLTMQGVAQLLTLGSLLKQSYSDVWLRIRNLSQSDVVVYSTRYHRTFQSGLALLFGLIPAETLSKLSFVESQSITFCFKDCACPITEKYTRALAKLSSDNLKNHPAVRTLASSISSVIFSSDAEHGNFAQNPKTVRDALFTYVCHDGKLPCDAATKCIRRQNVLGIFMYYDWMMSGQWKNRLTRRLSLLRSYGLVKHIVNQMLRMLSNNGPYLIVYSGHDHTLFQLAAALGLQYDAHLCRYAGRMVFEVYRNVEDTHTASGAYFRLLANGRDVTRQISFCKNARMLQDHISLCKIEDIIRFIHDDYFSSFNVTNFKDACFMKNIVV